VPPWANKDAGFSPCGTSTSPRKRLRNQSSVTSGTPTAHEDNKGVAPESASQQWTARTGIGRERGGCGTQPGCVRACHCQARERPLPPVSR